MIACIPAATLLGVEGRPVTVEIHVGNGLPGFTVVGLPDASCREARDRVRAALLSTGLAWPLRRVTVNLAPSGLRKAGSGLDLAIAVALLAATGVLEPELVAGTAFLGELGLDGSIRPVPGILSLVDAVAAPRVVVPHGAAVEAGLTGRHCVRAAGSLDELLACLRSERPWPARPPAQAAPAPAEADLADVRGQRLGRWALEVAAAGGHHLFIVGPPGSGKTMLARRLPSLLPELEPADALETTRIHSVAGLPLPPDGLVRRPPFRAPHHSASAVSLLGGGSAWLRPGEISCAHNGVLFVDELGEMPPSTLDALRQPLEEGVVRIARARGTVSLPARFLFVVAMNPCPCGDGTTPGACRCSDAERQRYRRRLSGPLLDRFDLRLPVHRPEVDELLDVRPGESSAAVAARVAAARERARARGVRCNAELPGPRLVECLQVTTAARRVFEYRLRAGSLTARGLHRAQRVARTIADLEGSPTVTEEHACGALELRADLDALGAR